MSASRSHRLSRTTRKGRSRRPGDCGRRWRGQNVMIKVPATPEGIPAIQQLISEGINVNVTLLFSQDAYERVAEAYLAGLEKYAVERR